MFCHYHPQRIALNRCQQCQSGLCQDCEVYVKGTVYCQKCAATVDPEEGFHQKRSPFLAAFLSLILPGLGQIYNGQRTKGVFIFLTCWLLAPWLYGIYDAFVTTRRINRQELIVPYPTLSCFVEGIGIFLVLLAIPFVVRRAVQHYWAKSEVRSEEIAVKDTLLIISGAVESYARDKGRYPQTAADLYFSQPPYLKQNYCGLTIAGYTYACAFSGSGYKISAISAAENTNGKKSYTIMTGGTWK